MGVKSCFRNGCDNIMCDTYILGIGYVCYECQNEFTENLGPDLELRETEIREKLEFFINTPKGTYSKDKIKVNQFFNKHTND